MHPRFTIVQKILALVAVLVALLLIVVVTTIVGVRGTERETASANRHLVPAEVLLLNIDRDLYQANVDIERLATITDAAKVKDTADDFEENVGQITERFGKFTAAAGPITATAEQGDWASFQKDREAWVAAARAVVGKAQGGSRDLGPLLTAERTAFKAARAHINRYEDQYDDSRFAKVAEKISDRSSSTTRNAISLLVLAVLIGGPLGLLVARSASRFIQQSAQRLAAQSGELAGLSAQLGADSQQTMDDAKDAAGEGRDAASNVGAVAAAIEEMDASIREIATSAAEANTIASRATAATEETNRKVARLGESSQEIGEVLDVITSIAEQTNLLALNATIEAARAGESGKGFAVVAHEVKELAKETARATEDISKRIATIQADTQAAAMSIGGIVEVIESINLIQTTIAGAVEEQTATTSEIARSITSASAAVSSMSARVDEVAARAASSGEGATAAATAATDLLEFAGALSGRARPSVSSRLVRARQHEGDRSA